MSSLQQPFKVKDNGNEGNWNAFENLPTLQYKTGTWGAFLEPSLSDFVQSFPPKYASPLLVSSPPLVHPEAQSIVSTCSRITSPRAWRERILVSGNNIILKMLWIKSYNKQRIANTVAGIHKPDTRSAFLLTLAYGRHCACQHSLSKMPLPWLPKERAEPVPIYKPHPRWVTHPQREDRDRIQLQAHRWEFSGLSGTLDSGVSWNITFSNASGDKGRGWGLVNGKKTYSSPKNK